MPAATPLTTPAPETVATDVLLLLQVPGPALLLKVVVRPAQVTVLPVIAPGEGLTVMAALTVQLPVTVYKMFAVPGIIPLTIPKKGSTVATEVLLLLHTPLPTELLRLERTPTHTFVDPYMGEGAGYTVIFFAAPHPVDME